MLIILPTGSDVTVIRQEARPTVADRYTGELALYDNARDYKAFAARIHPPFDVRGRKTTPLQMP